jgi:hypothetical protein
VGINNSLHLAPTKIIPEELVPVGRSAKWCPIAIPTTALLKHKSVQL